MKVLRCIWLLVLIVPVILVGCQSGSDGSKPKIYDVKGLVVSVEPDKKAVTLDHEDIPGYMKAMQMKFPVEKASTLDGIKAGDQVQGKLKVTGSEYVITDLQKR
jgi:protein SCO1/2